MVAFTIVIVFAILGLLIAIVLIKVNNKVRYQTTTSSNDAFNKFILNVSGAVYSMKMLNFYQYSGNAFLSSIFYGVASNYSYSNITNAMGNMVLNYDISALT